MKQLERATAILVVGPPGSGKSTIAGLLKTHLDVPWHDIDDIRAQFFGLPPPNDGTDPVIVARDNAEMAGTYNILFGVLDGFFRANRSVMITCTLSSRRWGQERVRDIYVKYPDANLKVVWCWPEITFDELCQRFTLRARSGYIGATTDPRRAWELRDKYEPIEALPHMKFDTGPLYTPEESAEQALDYILS